MTVLRKNSINAFIRYVSFFFADHIFYGILFLFRGNIYLHIIRQSVCNIKLILISLQAHFFQIFDIPHLYLRMRHAAGQHRHFRVGIARQEIKIKFISPLAGLQIYLIEAAFLKALTRVIPAHDLIHAVQLFQNNFIPGRTFKISTRHCNIRIYILNGYRIFIFVTIRRPLIMPAFCQLDRNSFS